VGISITNRNEDNRADLEEVSGERGGCCIVDQVERMGREKGLFPTSSNEKKVRKRGVFGLSA